MSELCRLQITLRENFRFLRADISCSQFASEDDWKVRRWFHWRCTDQHSSEIASFSKVSKWPNCKNRVKFNGEIKSSKVRSDITNHNLTRMFHHFFAPFFLWNNPFLTKDLFWHAPCEPIHKYFIASIFKLYALYSKMVLKLQNF